MKLYGKKDENELLNNCRTGAGHRSYKSNIRLYLRFRPSR